MAWDCPDPTSFDVSTHSISGLDAADRPNWYPDGPWYRPTANGDTITFDFTVSAGKRAYVNVQGYSDDRHRGFDIRIDGGAWMHENGTGGPTGNLVTLLTVPNVVGAGYFASGYGSGWEDGFGPGDHTLELRAAYTDVPTNLTQFEVNQYADCVSLRVGMLRLGS